MILKCQDHVTFKILSCDSVILALIPALPGSKSKETACTQSFSGLVPGPAWPWVLSLLHAPNGPPLPTPHALKTVTAIPKLRP